MFTQVTAQLIVKRADGSIAGLFPTVLDETTVKAAVRDLEAQFPGCTIDTSQVEAARRHLRSRAA
jgi:hypothetical protein